MPRMGKASESRTLTYILEKFGIILTASDSLPTVIPDFGRNQLAELFHELGFTKGAEIGVKRGEYSEVLLKANPLLKLYGVDPFFQYEAYRPISQERQEENLLATHERLDPYIKAGRYELIRDYSVSAVRAFELNNRFLDFVYWDGAHDFQNIANDICEWSKVVRPGGICAGHDYVRRTHGRDGGPNTSHHIVPVVNAYTEAFGIDPWFLLGTKVARPGEVRDKERSYLWVKS
jgi:hypothetical protein